MATRTVVREGVSFNVRVDRANWAEFWDWFAEGGWEPLLTATLDERMHPGALLVDFGAWVGPAALWAASRGARVLAIEPDPVACQALRDNVTLNDLGDLVTVVEGAIDTESGHAQINHAPVGELGDSRSRLSSSGALRVRTWTLPALLAEQGINPTDVSLVKMDVEGYETALCPALGPWLAGHGIPAVIELHGGYPDPGWFADYGVVRYPSGPLVLLP